VFRSSGVQGCSMANIAKQNEMKYVLKGFGKIMSFQSQLQQFTKKLKVLS